MLDDAEVFYIFDGEFVIHTPTALSAGKHIVTVKASDLFGNTTEKTWAFTVRNSEAKPWDVNGDGVVDISDLLHVGKAFGTSGEEPPADVNTDGVVNISDLVMVGVHFGETTNPETQAAPQLPSNLHADILEKWLALARAADDGSETFRRGIAVLEHLLSEITPEQTALLSNYPNPFNPETWIPYQLSKASNVSITVYDALGRVVKRFDVGHKQAGTYRTTVRAAHWDGSNELGERVASGAYFVLFKAEGYQQIRRIVLLK